MSVFRTFCIYVISYFVLLSFIKLILGLNLGCKIQDLPINMLIILCMLMKSISIYHKPLYNCILTMFGVIISTFLERNFHKIDILANLGAIMAK